jgi:hypothetical protein
MDKCGESSKKYGKKLLFVNKKTQKNFDDSGPWAGDSAVSHALASVAKVFWFFFSNNNKFLYMEIEI